MMKPDMPRKVAAKALLIPASLGDLQVTSVAVTYGCPMMEPDEDDQEGEESEPSEQGEPKEEPGKEEPGEPTGPNPNAYKYGMKHPGPR